MSIELTPQLIRQQAELQDLRWVAKHMLESHDRSAKRIADGAIGTNMPTKCYCSLCRHARPWLEAHEDIRFCTEMDERDASA